MSDRVSRWRSPAPATVLAVAVAVVVVLLVANPLAQLLLTSLSDPETGQFTGTAFVDAFSRPRYIGAIVNSTGLAALAALLAAGAAVPLAWGVARTDMPGRRIVHLGIVGTFVVPPFVGAIAWILLAGPNAGWLNRMWHGATGSPGHIVNVYSFFGLAFVIALYAFPLIYVFVSSALELIPADMEDAAQIHGGRALRVACRITLPLVAPAILGGMILVFLEGLTLYGTPALIGIPAGINVVSTQIAAFFSTPVRVEVAAAFSVPLVAFTAVLIAAQRTLVGRRSFTSVGGRAGLRRRISLGSAGWLLTAFAGLVLALSFLLPLLVLLTTALSVAWGRPPSLDNLTLANFRSILVDDATIRGAIRNTLVDATLAATLCTLLGFATAYIARRRVLPGGHLLGLLALTPFAIPGIVLAICFYAAYAGPPFLLYGTNMLIVIAFVTRFLPVALTTTDAGMRSLAVELEEAAFILGSGRLRILGRILAPLLRRTLLGAWVLIFISASRELSTAVFLSGPDSQVMSVLTLDLSEQGRFEQLAAMGLLMLLATGAVVAVASVLVGRDVLQPRG